MKIFSIAPDGNEMADMADIAAFLAKIKADKRCEIFPVSGGLEPLSNRTLSYPDDVLEFYSQCGGVRLFRSGVDNVSFEILHPNKIKQSNILIVGEECSEDISSTWYVICQTDNGDYISIDLCKKRLGRCYDSHYEVHGVIGSCPIIARDFTELLDGLYKTGGVDIFWRGRNYGDAYD